MTHSAFGIEKWNKVLKTLPIDKLVTETDAPFQHPMSIEPTNMPVNARYSIAAIVHARRLAQDLIAKKTFDNARKLLTLSKE